MKVKYEILYKSGHVDVIEQEVSEEEVRGINETIVEGFQEEADGILTFGDGERKGYFVRLSAVERVSIEIIEEGMGADKK